MINRQEKHLFDKRCFFFLLFTLYTVDMEIYIEYAFLENFLFDGALLSLALYAAKVKIKWWKICLSSCVGAIFAIVYPLLKLPDFLGVLLKIAVGLLLCLLVSDRVKTKKEWGRVALTALFFFIFSVSFGGTLLGLYGGGSKLPGLLVFAGFASLCGVSVLLVRKFYARRAVHSRMISCVLQNGEARVHAQAFLDSGNLAEKNGRSVCFLSPDLFYELFGEEILKGGGQVSDEMSIFTVAGEKTIPLYIGRIEVNGVESEVYFSPSKNMIGREYNVLLGSKQDESH